MNRNKTKDFFLDLGVTVALYTSVISLLNLLFTVINKAYPKITNGYSYFGSQSISWPVAVLIIFFPIFVGLMWVVKKDMDEERKNSGIHKFLTYLTLFIAGAVLAGDLITLLYFFIDGQELTTGFLLKVLALFVVMGSIFMYYISEIRGTLTSSSRNVWRIFALIVVLGSIIWGFSVLGSPRTQRLYKYDEQKLNDLMMINNEVMNYYSSHSGLPGSLAELSGPNGYFIPPVDQQSGNAYEYVLIGQSAKTYQICAVFNKASDEAELSAARTYPYGGVSWAHPAGRHCFTQTINPNMYPGVKPVI